MGNKCSTTEPEANSGGSSCQLYKKSYSSVIKSNLHSSPPATPTPPVEASTEIVSPEKTQQPLPNKSKTKSKMTRREKTPIVRIDSWENIPASVVEQEETWEKTSKKRKQRNKSQTQRQTRSDSQTENRRKRKRKLLRWKST